MGAEIVFYDVQLKKKNYFTFKRSRRSDVNELRVNFIS